MSLAGVLFDSFSGVLFLGLGLGIALLPPRRALKSFFGLYAFGLGLLVLMLNVPHLLEPAFTDRTPATTVATYTRLLASAGGFLASAGLVGIGWRVTRRQDGWRGSLVALSVLCAIAAAGLVPQLSRPWDAFPGLTALGSLTVSAGTFLLVRAASMGALVAIVIAAAAKARTAPEEVPQLAFLSLGIAPAAAFATGDELAHRLASGEAGALLYLSFALAALAAVALAWARLSLEAPQRQWPSAVAWSIPLLAATGSALYLVDRTGNTGAAGAVRTASVLVLGYATLRRDLFGATPRLQGNFQRGTLAMAFAAAFLVGGKLGEAFLDPPYDLVVSVLSMIALLVALDPLRRATDRLAVSAAEATAPPAHSGPPRPGVLLLGRYRIEERLGEGGQGAAYLCHDTLLGRAVVAKALPVRAGLGEHLDEARRLAKIRHPHVVEVFDAGQEGPYGYVVMGYVGGGSLAKRLERGPLGRAELARLASDILSALGACHRSGIIHGDVKPENVLLDEDGGAKLADFGSARLAGSGATARANALEGTLPYLAPEQVRGEAPTVASDLHAVAALLAVASGGAHPFARKGMDDFALRQAIVGSAPDLASVPETLRPALERALAKDPAARYSDAAAMLEAVGPSLA